MKTFYTTLEAIDPENGELKTWSGPRISANHMMEAEILKEQTGFGYLTIHGELIIEVGDLINENFENNN